MWGICGWEKGLGNKGKNLLLMEGMGISVPDGFIIPVDQLENEKEILRQFDLRIGKAPFSVRSSPRESMPGILETMLNVGFCEAALERFHNAPWANSCYQKLIRDYAYFVYGVEDYTFALLDQKYAEEDRLQAYLDHFAAKAGVPFPQNPKEQLLCCVKAVANSGQSIKAKAYQRKMALSTMETAVVVQKMVFGNRNERSGSGVYFTRNPVTGENAPYGEYNSMRQCDQVVQGKGGQDLNLLQTDMPEVYTQLTRIGKRLEAYFGDAQDIEFTIEDGKLYLLQTRNAQCTQKAQRKIGQALSEEGILPYEDYCLRHHIPSESTRKEIPGTVFCAGELICDGTAQGKACFTRQQALQAQKDGEKVILIVYHNLSLDMDAIFSADGIISVGGGKSSHFAVLVKKLGIPCVALSDHVKLEQCHKLLLDEHSIQAGDPIGLDGETILYGC